MEWAGHVAHMGEMENSYIILVENPEGKRPLGRPRRRWEDNIRIHLRKKLEILGRIHLAQDRDQLWILVNTVINLRVP
jgi:hypothetical protein